MKRPNFFIIGAPKCGTTAIYEYLQTHPAIFLPAWKEPYYFMPDQSPRPPSFFSKEQYDKLFEPATEKHAVVGEGSILYYSCPEALQAIQNFNNTAKLLLMLRNPVDMVASLHSHLLRNLSEDETDLEKAWDLQNARRAGRKISKFSPSLRYHMYLHLGSYDQHLESIYSIFPKHQVLVILYDDFVKDVRKVYVSILDFLEVCDDGKTSFPKINENMELRNPGFTAFFRSPPFPLNVIKSSLKKVFHIQNTRITNWLLNANLKVTRRRPLPPPLYNKLAKEFSPSVERLGKMIGRDLSHWSKLRSRDSE